MNHAGKKVVIKKGIKHLSTATDLSGRTGTIIKSNEPYHKVQMDRPLNGEKETPVLTFHIDSITVKK